MINSKHAISIVSPPVFSFRHRIFTLAAAVQSLQHSPRNYAAGLMPCLSALRGVQSMIIQPLCGLRLWQQLARLVLAGNSKTPLPPRPRSDAWDAFLHAKLLQLLHGLRHACVDRF